MEDEKKNLSKQERIQKSRQKFIDKWGFDIWGYTAVYDELLALIKRDSSCPLRFLEIDCGMGADLSKIKYIYPYSYAAGIEQNSSIRRYSRFMGDIIFGDPCSISFPWAEESFDYIYAGDRLGKNKDQTLFLKKIRPYLKSNGIIIFTVSDGDDFYEQKALLEENGFQKIEVRDGFITAVR